MSSQPAIKIGNVFRYRQRYGIHGLFKVAELVLKRRSGWWVIGHDRKKNRTVEVRPGCVFPRNATLYAVQHGPLHRWPQSEA